MLRTLRLRLAASSVPSIAATDMSSSPVCLPRTHGGGDRVKPAGSARPSRAPKGGRAPYQLPQTRAQRRSPAHVRKPALLRLAGRARFVRIELQSLGQGLSENDLAPAAND